MERDPNVVLPDAEARCVPSKPCHFAGRCARALAPMPTHGATIADFSLFVVPMFGCQKWRAIEWRKRK